MAGPLTDIRILDLSRVMAGPWCTQILADLGAEVIKIERPGVGDETRYWGPPWQPDEQGGDSAEASYYLSANRGKHSLTIDISQSQGQQIVRDLAAKSDVFIENFKLDSLKRKGLGYEDIKAVKPDIIYCSITGFGQTGPRANEAGYDYLIQGLGGLMSITGIEDGNPGAGPIRVGLPVADLATGLYSTIAIVSALVHRQKTGQGQYIDMALMDSLVGILGNQAQNYFLSDQCPTRTGNWHPNLAPYQTFHTKDKDIIIAVGNDDQFRRFCQAIGSPELADDERFSLNSNRVINRELLIKKLEVITRTRSCDEWIETLQKVGIPCGPINTLQEVFQEPQVNQREMKINLEHPLGTQFHSVANPIKFSETAIEYSKPPPLLGEDTIPVLTGLLGMDEAELNALQKNKII